MLYPSIFRNDLFDDIFDDFMRPDRPMFNPANSIMKTDIKESDASYELSIDLPGFKKENVSAELKDGVLTVKASNNIEDDAKDGKYLRRERFFGSCSRSFYVGEELTQDDIKAKFDNGILILTVPKKLPQPKIEQKQFINIEG